MNLQVTTNENIDKKVNEWDTSTSTLPIYDYLGITKNQYAAWVETGVLPKE